MYASTTDLPSGVGLSVASIAFFCAKALSASRARVGFSRLALACVPAFFAAARLVGFLPTALAPFLVTNSAAFLPTLRPAVTRFAGDAAGGRAAFVATFLRLFLAIAFL